MCDERWRIENIIDSPEVDGLLRENLVIVIGEALAALRERSPDLARRAAENISIYAFGTKSCNEHMVFTTLIRALYAWAYYLEGERNKACRYAKKVADTLSLVQGFLGSEAASYVSSMLEKIDCSQE